MTVRQRFELHAEDPAEHVAFISNPDHRAEHDAIAHPEVEFCTQNCEGEPADHPVTWRIHPRPDPRPGRNDGVITDLVECCTCCAWSCGTEGFVDRLQRESYDGRDITIERLVDGRWTNFEMRF